MEDITAYRKFIKEKEGDPFLTATKAFKHEKFLTLGHGDYGPHIKKGQTTTVPEADVRLDENIRERLPKIKKAIPNFDAMPEDVRVDLFASWYRGGLSGSPETIKLINQGKFNEAAKEFLNNNEYKNTELKGIKDRMNQTSNIINSLAPQQQSKFTNSKSQQAFLNVLAHNDLAANEQFLNQLQENSIENTQLNYQNGAFTRKLIKEEAM